MGSLLAGLLTCLCLCGGGVNADEQLKIITHNVWYGFTKKPAPRKEQWLKWLKREAADVVCLQELNGYDEKQLAADAAHWGHSYSVLLKTDGFPTGITSKSPISQVVRRRDGFHHGLLRCQVAGLWFYVVHFAPSDYAHRIEAAKLVAEDIATIPEADPQIVLAGDFNGFSPADAPHYAADTKLIPFFQKFDATIPNDQNLKDGKLDYGAIQEILTLGFMDIIAGRRSDKSDFVGTFPTQLVSDVDHGSDRRLDYIFVSPNLADRVETAAILRNQRTEMLSDHAPVTVTLRLDSR